MYVNHDPLTDTAEDRLKRAKSAKRFARDILQSNYQRGLVVGIMGDWGDGKSTYLNFLRSWLESSETTNQVIEFNPWMFSGSNQLAELFLAELAQELSSTPKMKKIGNAIGGLGTLISIFDGFPAASLIGKVAAKAGKFLSKDASVSQQRRKIESLLSEIDKPLVVLIDDIDRLSSGEIREIFKLVRLVANFPNVIYLLAFDRRVVASALKDDHISGDDYLEKIIQIPVQLPAIPQAELQKALLEDLSKLPSYGAFDDEFWTDIYLEVVSLLVCNMRDVNKYVSAVSITQSFFQGSISMVDIMALESIRLFLPELFDAIQSNKKEFADPFSMAKVHNLNNDSVIHEILGKLNLGEKRVIAESFIKRVLPVGYSHIGPSHTYHDPLTWLRKRRVAHISLLQYYFEKEENQQLREFVLSEKMYSCMGDERALSEFLEEQNHISLCELLNELSRDEERFLPEHFVPTTVVMFGCRDKGADSCNSSEYFVFVAAVKTLAKASRNFILDVERIFNRLDSLSSKQEFINILRRSKLITDAIAVKYERAWYNDLVLASRSDIVLERRAANLLKDARSYDPHFVDECLVSEDIAMAVLDGSEIKGKAWGSGSSHIYDTSEYDVDFLKSIFGSEKAVLDRYSSIKEDQGTEQRERLFEQLDRV